MPRDLHMSLGNVKVSEAEPYCRLYRKIMWTDDSKSYNEEFPAEVKMYT